MLDCSANQETADENYAWVSVVQTASFPESLVRQTAARPRLDL